MLTEVPAGLTLGHLHRHTLSYSQTHSTQWVSFSPYIFIMKYKLYTNVAKDNR